MTKRNSLYLACLALLGSFLFFPLYGQTVYEGLVVRSPLPTINNITNLKHANGKFLATTDRSGILLSSDDGTTWITHKTPHTNSLQDVAYGNGMYFIASSGSGPAITEEYEVSDNGDGTETVSVRILEPLENLPSWFVRLVLGELI